LLAAFEQPVDRDADLLPLVAHRLAQLNVDDDLLVPRLAGMLRRTWYANQLALGELAADVARIGGIAVVTGRAASVLRYLPAIGVQAIGRVEIRTDWRGPTADVDLLGTTVRVPATADHLLDALLRGWWPDAVAAAARADVDWERFVAEARRRRLRVTLRRRLAVLDDLARDQLVPGWVAAALRPGPWASLGERLRGVATLIRQRITRPPDTR
jgi:hypothetical protein